VTEDVTAALETFRPDIATNRLADFIGNLSCWYIRLARRRFAGPADADQRAKAQKQPGADLRTSAVRTLRTCLDVLTRLMAPIVPFLTDEAWNLIRPDDPAGSVHRAAWPQVSCPLLDRRLNQEMAQARRLVALGRAARASARIAGRQPLARARISVRGSADLGPHLLALVADELNVKSIEPGLPDSPAATPRTGSGPRPARWVAASGSAGTVALDTAITPELRDEGLARLATRVIQDARRRLDLPTAAKIAVGWDTTSEEVAGALGVYAPLISRTTRATEFGPMTGEDAASAGYISLVHRKLNATLWLRPPP
jgi:isoleucyl-tRNA synthetase